MKMKLVDGALISRVGYGITGTAFSILLMAIFVLSGCAPGEHGRETLVMDRNGCVLSQEICGDGLDQDCDGADLPCPGSDADFDGFDKGADCDDSNRYIYPGIVSRCEASCGQGAQRCLPNGAFTPCSCEPVCEAQGNGRCYYV